MEAKIFKINSTKHNIHGEIKHYGFVTKLCFTYNSKDVEIAIHLNPFSKLSPEELGESIINTYIDNLADDNRKIKMHYFYVKENKDETGVIYRTLHGNISGHPKIDDSVYAHSSYLESFYIDEDSEELIGITHSGSTYHCPLAYCDFKKQDDFSDIIPNYEDIKEKYKDSIVSPTIEAGNVLLVLSNFDDYYFNSLYYTNEDLNTQGEYKNFSHVGTFQDSYLILGDGIDIRYFPHFRNIEFYSSYTNERPLYVENIGDVVLYVKSSVGLIKLNPNDRKLVAKENAEEEKPSLPDGDLYPAGIY